jgi:BTB/POZ domain/NHL repeat
MYVFSLPEMASVDNGLDKRMEIKTRLLTAAFDFKAVEAAALQMWNRIRDLQRLEKHVHAKLQIAVTAETNWVTVQTLVQKHAGRANEKVRLDIGGKIFSTTKSRLLSFKNSFFEAMLGSGHWKASRDGTYFVDRTPTFFEHMLEFMRTGKLDSTVLAWSGKRRDKLREEFDFYQIPFPTDLLVSSCQGRLIRVWGQRGEMDGEFNGPRGLTISDENELYVSDSCNFRVQVFDLHGRFQRKWELYGLGYPMTLATGWGQVYLIGHDTHNIRVYTSEGEMISTWGTHGQEDGQFKYPTSLKCDTVNDLIYVVDTGNDRIQIFNRNCIHLKTVKLEYGMHLPEQLILVRAMPMDMVVVADRTGHVCVFTMQWDTERTQLSSVLLCRWKTFSIKPFTLALSEDHDIYVCEKNSNRISVCTVHGLILREFALPGPPKFEITCIAMSKQGALFILDRFGNQIMQLY